MAWPLDRPVPGGFGSDPRTRVYVWQTDEAYPTDSLATAPKVVEEMPSDAADTGFHRNDWQLWISEAEFDEAVYLTDGDTIERWAHAKDSLGCI
jgi:hypothetical protein